ncbi:MAG: hypothetical protein HYY65_14530 [Candidatus Tectomicrobia bacterium]|uniref:Uncharacterized protein n=1 Tax=Tectimicrobiota bacterium TaxID=2528274 RepID=A0A932GS47_UNCTE|nr:hypothetical protein [Candidatus Tectomicrobia bacterium]
MKQKMVSICLAGIFVSGLIFIPCLAQAAKTQETSFMNLLGQAQKEEKKPEKAPKKKAGEVEKKKETLEKEKKKDKEEKEKEKEEEEEPSLRPSKC